MPVEWEKEYRSSICSSLNSLSNRKKGMYRVRPQNRINGNMREVMGVDSPVSI